MARTEEADRMMSGQVAKEYEEYWRREHEIGWKAAWKEYQALHEGVMQSQHTSGSLERFLAEKEVGRQAKEEE